MWIYSDIEWVHDICIADHRYHLYNMHLDKDLLPCSSEADFCMPVEPRLELPTTRFARIFRRPPARDKGVEHWEGLLEASLPEAHFDLSC